MNKKKWPLFSCYSFNLQPIKFIPWHFVFDKINKNRTKRNAEEKNADNKKTSEVKAKSKERRKNAPTCDAEPEQFKGCWATLTFVHFGLSYRNRYIIICSDDKWRMLSSNKVLKSISNIIFYRIGPIGSVIDEKSWAILECGYSRHFLFNNGNRNVKQFYSINSDRRLRVAERPTRCMSPEKYTEEYEERTDAIGSDGVVTLFYRRCR